jgi:hypothetical protein
MANVLNTNRMVKVFHPMAYLVSGAHRDCKDPPVVSNMFSMRQFRIIAGVKNPQQKLELSFLE